VSDFEGLHVVFGAGAIGLAVVDELTARGSRVRVVNRAGTAAVPAGVQVVTGDATDPASAKAVCNGASVVYNCANPPYHKWPEMFPAIQAGILEGAAAAGARLVAMDNLYMYGPTEGKPLTEDLPYRATTRKGATRARMAEDLLSAHRSGKVRVTIGRASDYFGPRGVQSAAGERVFKAAIAGKRAQVVGNPDILHTYTYVPDIGKALVTLAERDEALGRAWHLPNPETVTTRQFVELIFKETGHPARLQVAPRLLLRAMGVFVPAAREVLEMLYEFEEPFVVDSSAFRRTFGVEATPLAEAIRVTVAWYRGQAAS